MKRKPLTVDQHREMAKFIRDPKISRMSCEIQISCGPSSRPAKLTFKISNWINRLQSELEGQLAKDHPASDHTGIYYGEEIQPKQPTE